MRLIKENIERDGSGSVTLYPEDPEDMVRLQLRYIRGIRGRPTDEGAVVRIQSDPRQ